MELGAIFLLLLVFVIVVLFVVWPFIRHWRVQTESGHEISALLAERDHVLDAIQELDFDNSLGKIPPEQYPFQRNALVRKGAEVLHQLDSLAPSTLPFGRKEGSGGESADRRFGEMGDALLSSAGDLPVAMLSDDDLEELIAKRRTARKEKTAGFCPKCGKPLMQSDKFCPSCGQAVKLHQ